MENQQRVCENVGSAFVKYYYELFDTDRTQLYKLYTPESIAIWEGKVCYGKDQIMEKITNQFNLYARKHYLPNKKGPLTATVGQKYAPGQNLPIKKIQRTITSHDHQIVAGHFIMSTVLGQLRADDDPIMGFQQSFILKPVGNSWVCVNESFRLAIYNFNSANIMG